jgi:ribosomal protein S18 acetylase RimI-like enzyme
MVTIRPLTSQDLPALTDILRRTPNFLPDEVEVALELLIESAHDPQSTYKTLVALDEQILGYVCYGRTPMTDHTYDLYWIVVDPTQHGKGLGRALYQRMEHDVRNEGGKIVRIETSSSEGYENTKAFYHRLGFEELNHIRDFYRAGDHLITFVAYL